MRTLLILLGFFVLAFAVYTAAGPALEGFRDGRRGGGSRSGGGGRPHLGGGGRHPGYGGGGRHHHLPGPARYTYVGGGGSSDWGWDWRSGWPAWGWAWGWPWAASCELTGCPAGYGCVYDPMGYSYCTAE